MRPLQISAETAVTLSQKLGVPIEHLMHMPQHILMQKLAELAKEESSSTTENPDTSTEQEKDNRL